MNPEHYHLEFYENDGGTMPVLEWLNKLESDDSAKHDAVIYGLQVILAREGAGVCGTDFGKNLGKGLCEFRLRHTRDELQAKAEPHRSGSKQSAEPAKVLADLKAQRQGRGADPTAGPNRPEDRVPRRRSFLMWSRRRRPGAGRR